MSLSPNVFESSNVGGGGCGGDDGGSGNGGGDDAGDDAISLRPKPLVSRDRMRDRSLPPRGGGDDGDSDSGGDGDGDGDDGDAEVNSVEKMGVSSIFYV